MNRRKELVLAMERLVRSCNNEELLMEWLAYGVPDGDIKNYTVDEVDDSLVEDEEFAILMGMFLRIMVQAEQDGGLYVDGIVSKVLVSGVWM